VNTDGFGDAFFASTASSPDGRTNAGAVFAMFGSRELPEIVDVLSGDSDLLIEGDRSNDRLGMSLARADFGGDGFDDIVTCAIYASPLGREGAGEAYLIRGTGTPASTYDLNQSVEDLRFLGEDEWDLLGEDLVALDFDGDGGLDLVMGAWRADPGGRIDAGMAYGFLGSAEDTALQRKALGSGDSPAAEFHNLEFVVDFAHADSAGILTLYRLMKKPLGTGSTVLGRSYAPTYSSGGATIYRVTLRYREEELLACGLVEENLRIGIRDTDGWRVLSSQVDTATNRVSCALDLTAFFEFALGDSVGLSVLCGDANLDGEITPADGYVILNYFGSGSQPSFWAGDTDGSSGLTPADGYWILNFLGSGLALECQGFSPPPLP
jgi:hypothetical protein